MTVRPVIVLLVGLFSAGAFATEISGFRVWTDPEKTRAVLDLSTRTDYRLFTLANPDRVVIGTDNYARMDVEQPNALIEGLRMPEADLERMLSGNAKRLFRL